MSRPAPSLASMRRPAIVVALLALGVGAWASRALSIPFWLTNDVTSVLVDWQKAGLSCDGPEVGMPGPAVDWFCRRTFAGVAVRARLTADSHGVQSIIAGVPAGTTGEDAARAFDGLLEVTSLFSSAKAGIGGWLLASNAADGVMPSSSTGEIGRASVTRDSEGGPVLYLTPLGSSILLTE